MCASLARGGKGKGGGGVVNWVRVFMKVASVGYINDQRFTYFIIFEILRLMLIVD